MGHEAAITKKTVLDKVKQCVAVANIATSRAIAVETQHNAFVARLEADNKAFADDLAACIHWQQSCGLDALRQALSHQDKLFATFQAARWYVRVWALLRWLWTGEVKQ